MPVRVGILLAFASLLVACPKPTAQAEDAAVAPSVVDASVAMPAAADAGSAILDSTPHLDASHHAAPAPTPAHSAADAGTKGGKAPAKAAAASCKPGEVDNGEGCFKPCNSDKDCAKPMTCQSMMVGNPNGGTSTAMVCQKP